MKYKKSGENNVLVLASEVFNRNILGDQDTYQCFLNIKDFSKELYHHSLNVSLLSFLLGMERLDDTMLEEVFVAALLHDYGKLFISKSILDKNGLLTEEERQTVELHSIVGYFYLQQQTNLSENVLFGVLDHHEKVDGTGYGLCKKNDSINDIAKIIAIADVYDAMVSDRVYRKRIEKEKVCKYLMKNAGKKFDYELTRAFIEIASEVDLELLEKKFLRVAKASQIVQVGNS